MIKALTTIGLLALSTSGALAQKVVTIHHSFYGCIRERDARSALDLYLEKDFTATVRVASNGRCKMLKTGVQARVLKFDFQVSCIRPAGEPYCLWFPNYFTR